MAADVPAAAHVHEVELKLAVLGNSSVGKSCLLSRLCFGRFPVAGTMLSTVGVDFAIKTLQVDGVNCRLTVWDTAGQERFRSISSSFYRSTHGLAICYSCGDRDTFAAIESWLLDIASNTEVSSVPLVLIATKADLSADSVQVLHSEGAALASRHGIPFFSTSALTGLHVDSAFRALARAVLASGGGKRRQHGHRYGASPQDASSFAREVEDAARITLSAAASGGRSWLSRC